MELEAGCCRMFLDLDVPEETSSGTIGTFQLSIRSKLSVITMSLCGVYVFIFAFCVSFLCVVGLMCLRVLSPQSLRLCVLQP